MSDSFESLRIGAIYYHTNFVFKNGGTSDKLLIQLNEPSDNEPYIFVITTSQEEYRLKEEGCQEYSSEFFINANKDFFNVPTWIELYRPVTFDAGEVTDALFKTKLMKCIGILSDKTITELKNCVKRLPIIEIFIKNLIIESYNNRFGK